MDELRHRANSSSGDTSLRWAARLVAGFAFVGSLFAASVCAAQAPTPEVLYYRFNEVGTAVTNQASSPPAGTASATLMGGLTQGGAIGGTFLSAVVGTGVTSTTDFVDTGWATNLSGSWSISFFSDDVDPSATLFYVMGDANASQFRIFTNGVAGPNNWIMRGTGITDTLLSGGAVPATTMNTFVYDNTALEIRAYLNGVLVNTVPQGAPVVISGPGPFKVIGYGSNVGLNAGGKVGDVRVYSHALSPTEITNIYNAAFLPPAPPATVPTLSEWALILLSLLLGAFGLLMLQRRRAQTLQF